MRLLTAITITSIGALASAQRDLYPTVESAVIAAQAQANIVMDVGGWQTSGGRTERFQLRLFTKEGKVYAEQFVNDAKRLVIIADGKKVWRYDPVVNEYTFINQPNTGEPQADFRRTLEMVAAWSRKQLQRPIRTLAGSVRWLVIPQFDGDRHWVRAFQTRPLGGEDWRGTDTKFSFDDQGRLIGLTAEDRLDLRTGFEHTWLDGVLAFPPTLEVSFAFTPPVGAKPAADLPVRLPGDGGRGGGTG